MDKSITVVVETSDKVNICVNVILALKLVEGMSEKVRDAVRVALLSEIWKKPVSHGSRRDQRNSQHFAQNTACSCLHNQSE